MKGYNLRQVMADNGVKVIDIANNLGISHAAVSKVIHNKSASARIREAIATAIGCSVTEIFPPTPKEPT